MTDRFLLFYPLMFALALLRTAVVAEEIGSAATLTEAEAVARGLALPAYADVVQTDVAMARARARESRLWPNPGFFYSREDAAGSVEDIVSLTQELTLSGSRGLRMQAADHLVSVAEQSVERRRDIRAARIRIEFHSVLLGQKRIAATVQWARQLAAAAQAVARRETAGDVSAYDRLRVERELHNAESRVATERAALEESWTRLAPLVGIEPRPDDDWPMLVGTLLPAMEPLPLEDLAAAIEARADMQALEKQVQAAELQGDAAARGWIPSVTLGAGAKIVDADGNRDTGPIVTAFIPIPVFQREQPERMRADADARHTRAELLLRQAESLARLRGAWRNVTRLTEAARRFARNTEDGSVQLVRSAEAAYRGGEIGVLELVDAYRAGLDDELRLLDLQLEARRTRIELDLTAGGGF